MNTAKTIIFSLFALSIAACSNGGGGSGGAVPVTPTTTSPVPQANKYGKDIIGDFSYEFRVNACTTGKQKLKSKNAYCDVLLDDAKNNNCAREMRIEAYNRTCVGTQQTNTAVLSSMATARCEVNGMDLKDRTFLEELNPFNPQRRQTVREMFWTAKKAKSYGILGSIIDSYGRASFKMTPSRKGQVAYGEIFLSQQEGNNSFFARSGLGSQIRMTVTNYELEKEVEAVCLSDKSFRVLKSELRQITCSLNYKRDGRKARQYEEVLAWDVANTVEKEIFRRRGRESIRLSLKPAVDGQDPTIGIEMPDLDTDKMLRAEASLNEGLEVGYKGRKAHVELTVNCSAASK